MSILAAPVPTACDEASSSASPYCLGPVPQPVLQKEPEPPLGNWTMELVVSSRDVLILALLCNKAQVPK